MKVSTTNHLSRTLFGWLLCILILVIVIGYNVFIVSKLSKEKETQIDKNLSKSLEMDKEMIIYKTFWKPNRQMKEFNNLKINFVLKSENKKQIFHERYEIVAKVLSTLKTKSELFIYSKSGTETKNNFLFKRNEKFLNGNLGDWFGIMTDWSNRCKRNSYSLFLNDDEIIVHQMLFHILSLRLWMKEKKILGIKINEGITGFLLRCDGIPLFLKEMEKCLRKNNNCFELPLQLNGQYLLTYRYNLLINNVNILKELKLNPNFDYFNCKESMISPCENSKLFQDFEFRDERLITVDLALNSEFNDKFMTEIGVTLLQQRGYQCSEVCKKNKQKCLTEALVLVNNCKIMKDSYGCLFCMSFDEGDDQPYQIGLILNFKKFIRRHLSFKKF
jgi:hypothetical protein